LPATSARIPEPHLHRRARHDAEGRRRGHLAVDPPPRRHHQRRSARNISASPRGRARRKASLRCRRAHAELAAREQFILTVCANGYGKLSSAYEYRRTGRGGQGITNIDNIARNGPVVASFPATQADQLMLVTDQAKLIRLPLESLRVIGRGSAGVRLFNVADRSSTSSTRTRLGCNVTFTSSAAASPAARRPGSSPGAGPVRLSEMRATGRR
jgi:hypothetical protein